VEAPARPPAEPAYLTAFRAGGNDVVGSWVIVRDKSEIDDSPRVRALVGLPEQTTLFGDIVLFQVGCNEGEPTALILTDEYLLADNYAIAAIYRLDDLSAVNESWNLSTNNKAAGYWGKEALRIAETLKGHKKLVVQVTERRGEQHRYSFNIDGVDEALAAVGLECGWSGFGVTADEMKQAQEKLKKLGFYKGGIDGQWGAGSRAALIEFQKSKGLPPTGLLDKVTRAALAL
jgi:hypothetical protein